MGHPDAPQWAQDSWLRTTVSWQDLLSSWLCSSILLYRPYPTPKRGTKLITKCKDVHTIIFTSF